VLDKRSTDSSKDRINRLDVTATSFTPAEPLSTAHPTRDHGQSSPAKRSLLLALHGVEQLLKRVEPCLARTPAKVPVTVLNTIIDIGMVCLHLAECRCND
jgi:hypothetical protein